ncbi:insulin-like receptor [Orussus abietinus]|uniref:insulin-like receptor n=1 Tax=Orussus abietinus TaxID=222816 RepID=UPI00062624C3|nr:insulin-like receptor [Orussus abietinus]XP_012280343.1 insulin-like receptor [Orussus abietinus]XP_012280344.1 insulin-like receptor [Orussus abietinus]XP_012280345.1 insulin-like receptor [Orussus abietinus]XP_012280346.1 insulin-like receptor [Orussus abietinus]XP_023289633.1 insulin-like receptor [Orussus abietinus]
MKPCESIGSPVAVNWDACSAPNYDTPIKPADDGENYSCSNCLALQVKVTEDFVDSEFLQCDICKRLRNSAENHEEGCNEVSYRQGYLQRLFPAFSSGKIGSTCRRDSVDEGRWLRCASSVVRWTQGKRRMPWQILIWLTAMVLLTLAAPCVIADSQNSILANTSVANTFNKTVCQSVDIRNNVNQFSRLDGCRVVEGFVQILLIDNADDQSYANLTFPNLVEITGYLILYRVYGLQSIGHLFPNLAVIRGHSLFFNYALVVFEMMHLQEIGLYSLTDILRGSVRFEKNPVLCNADTIDWDIIAKAGKGEHVISSNKPKNVCPVCEKHCPTRLTKPDETLCWNRQHCQRLCDRKCGDKVCSKTNECCHPSCIGGCTGKDSNSCIACRELVLPSNVCVPQCPSGTYEYLNRRCVQADECRRMKRPREASMVKEFPYKPFNNTCVMECPAGYMDDGVDARASCKKCDGPCLKKCAGTSVDSIASAQRLRGCTHIVGSLEIQIRGGKNIVKELEDSLSMIEEIDGYLKIVRCFPLISLNFLKNLKIIRGNSLDNSKYTLAVLDNQNLQELWDWDSSKKIKILSKDGPAKIFFHFNPKLCLKKIEKLREVAGLQEFTDLDVAPNSNGDKVACDVTELVTRITRINTAAALIEWDAFEHHDPRSLLGYVVYVIEAPTQNVTMYDGRDACGGDGWRVDDVSSSSTSTSNQSVINNANKTTIETKSIVTHILTLLNPYTQYAFYVKTYTIATERSGALSKVKYFTTLPGTPSAPRALSTWSNSSSELVMSWSPPLHKNGNLTHYRIVGRWEKDDSNFLEQRDYCNEPMLLPEKKPMSVMVEEERKKAEAEKELIKIPETATCECSDSKSDPLIREKEVSSSIAFEDALHNQVYVKRISSRRRRDTRESRALNAVTHESNAHVNSQDKKNGMDVIKNGSYVIFERNVSSSSFTFVMKELRHFAAYNIEVLACRERIPDDAQDKPCSTKSMRTYRTLPLESADDIPPESFQMNLLGGNNSLTTVKLQWKEPPQPNGLIVAYQIEYKRVDIKNIKGTVVCITRRDFVTSENTYLLKDLSPGNYSVKVRATSLAGNGAYTNVRYFYIEEYNTTGKFWIMFWSIGFIVIVILPLIVFYVYKRKLMRNVPSMRLIATVNPEYVSTAYVPDEWEVPRKKIQLLRELGNGSFGMVYEGIAKDVVKGKPEVRCAVKTVNENATDRERIEFLNEASVMKAFNTHHVVRLLGVVSQGQPTLVVMELMVNGDLKTYLRSHRPDVCENILRQPPTLKRILQMAIEIADGMAYLAAKKFVHRDLAARNCMVAEDLTVKIGDFGMTRDIYETDYYRKGTKGLLPVRWMAPESLKDGLFTSYSDVWSYGVVLWEMVTLASQPYQGLSNDQVLRYVIDGGVMERPENCPDSLYTLMRRTWNHKASKRPTFIDIATMLLQEINVAPFERVSFYHSPDGVEARNQNSQHSPQTDKDFEIVTLHELREDEAEAEGDEDSPLRRDFGDFASFEPTSIKSNSTPRYGSELYGENSKIPSAFHDLPSSKIPLKAGFEDFDDVSAESMSSSKDTLNLPFAEDSLKSVKSSPFSERKTPSRSNASLASTAKSTSPRSMTKSAFPESPEAPKPRGNSDYENRSPERVSLNAKNASTRIEIVDINDVVVDDQKEKSPVEYVNRSETLNNGYIGGATT